MRTDEANRPGALLLPVDAVVPHPELGQERGSPRVQLIDGVVTVARLSAQTALFGG